MVLVLGAGQRRGQTPANRLPAAADGGHGATCVHGSMLRADSTARARATRAPAAARAAAAGAGQVPDDAVLAGLHMEGAGFLCAHSESDDATMDSGPSVATLW